MAEQNDPMQDVLFREVDEDLRQEELKQWWDKYGLFVILFVALALGAAAGYEGFKAWRKGIREADAIKYEQAIKDRTHGKSKVAADLFLDLAKNGKTGYADLARLQFGSMMATGGDEKTGLETLKTVIKDESVHPVLRDLARYKLAGYLVKQGALDEAKKQLAKISGPESEWHFVAMEMEAAIALEENDIDGARKILTRLASELVAMEYSKQDSGPRNLRQRTMELLDTLGGPLTDKPEPTEEQAGTETQAKAETDTAEKTETSAQ